VEMVRGDVEITWQRHEQQRVAGSQTGWWEGRPEWGVWLGR